MKSMRLCAFLILSAMSAVSVRLAAQSNPSTPPAPSAAAPASAASGPIIRVDNAEYDFGKTAVGEKVLHTYLVTNTGNETLQITNVHPSCGCTTVGNWTHEIAAGQSGEITVQLDTSRGGAGMLTKTIDVYSNARNTPRQTLLLKGTVWKPIEATPSTASIIIPPDSTNEMSTTVQIVNQTDVPVTMSNAFSANQLFTASLKETKPGKEYELLITAKPPFPSVNMSGTIAFNTSLPGTPSVMVTAIAVITPAVQISPPRIVLGTMPDRWLTNRITIKGNTTNVLALSNARASDSRIKVDVVPAEIKGTFALLVAVPPGFELIPGKTVEVTVESNHPRFPVIKIPVLQYPRPRPAAAPPMHPNPAQVAGHP